jgi:hypothetical protein
MAWWPVERWEALRLALGARGRLAARGGSVDPASKGASQASWRLPPLHRTSAVRWWRSCWQTSDALRRENASAWLFESSNQNLKRGISYLAPLFYGERSTRIVRCASGEGPGTAVPDAKPIGSEGPQHNKHDPRVRRLDLPQCLAPHPKPSLRSGFDLSPRKSGERLERRAAQRPGHGTQVASCESKTATPSIPPARRSR